MAAFVIAIVATIWATATVWLAVGALIRRRQLELHCLRRHDSPSGRPVLVMRPCAGEEEALERCLVSVAESKRSFPIEVVMGVATPQDTALPALRRAAARLREQGIDTRVEVCPPRGPNRKVSTMATICESSAAPIIVGADSNVDLAGFDLDVLVGRLEADPKTGITWSPHAEHAVAQGLGPRASMAVLGGSLMGFPMLVGIHPTGLNGKLWACRRTSLEQIGGLSGLLEYLGEDLEMARRLQNEGLSVVPVSATVRALGGPASFRDVVLRISRWMTVVRAQVPHLLPAYPILFAPTPLIFALAAVCVPWAPRWSILAVSVAAAGRLMVALGGQHYAHRPWSLGGAIVDCVLADAVILAAWARALARRDVVWRGTRLRLDARGRIEVIEPPPTPGHDDFD